MNAEARRAPERTRALFFEYRRTGDRGIRDELVESHLPLANHLARRHGRRGEPFDDLLQVASVGLLKAIDRFDPRLGLEFSTFAVPTIVGEIKRYYRDRTWMVRVPRSLQERSLEIARALADLTHELQRSPTIPEVAERVGLTTEAVAEAIEAGHAHQSDSLDAPAAGAPGESEPLSALLGAEDPRVEAIVDRLEVEAALMQLPERERAILVLRFFDGLTQTQIAQQVGVSQMHVSRLLARSLAKLRTALDAGATDDLGRRSRVASGPS